MKKAIEVKYQIVSTIESGNFYLTGKKQVDTKAVVSKVRKAIRQALTQYVSGNYSIDFHSLKNICSSHLENKLVGVNVQISNLGEQEVIDLNDEDLINGLGLKRTKIKVASITITDGDQEIKCLNLCDDKSFEQCKGLIGKRIRAIGIPLLLPVENRKSKIRYLILEFSEQTNPLELLCATEAEKKWVTDWANQKKQAAKSLLNLLEIRALKALKINLSENNIMRKVIRFSILMVLSGGRTDIVVLCLNLFLIGRSGAGKKIVTNVVEFLSPVFREAHANRVNKVGLVGPTSFKDGKWSLTPGLLPQANGGCFAIQDAHSIEDMKAAAGVFSMCMEDGIVKSSNAAMAQADACVSLLLDMNRKEHILGQKPDNEVDDLWGLPIHVLTRFDCIVDLPTNLDQQFQVSLDMIKNFNAKQVEKFEENKRRAKLIVAYMKHTYSVIEIPTGVKEYAVEKWNDYFVENREIFEEFPNLADFQLRMVNSLLKLIIVIARSNFRNVATISDVDEAAQFLKFKLNYLEKAASGLSSDALTKSIKNKPKYRQKVMAKNFKGRTVSFSEIKDFYAENFGFSQTDHPKKIYRDLETIADRAGKGDWRFN